MSRTNAPLLRVPCQSAVESSSSQCNSRQCPSPAAVFSRAFPAASFTGDQLYIYPPTGMLYMKGRLKLQIKPIGVSVFGAYKHSRIREWCPCGWFLVEPDL
mmetsp:Transcript_60723/g.51425  ORF Transcript_60723/g.51425 Transcript_60723/m.51425 type:complete len:101 (+) Transcript_60723:539-841(+)